MPVALAAALLILLNPLGIDLYLPALPEMTAQLGSSATASLGAFVLGLGLGQLGFGPLSDRIGRRPVVLIGLLGYTMASFAAAIAHSAAELLLWRVVHGLAASATAVCAFSMIRDHYRGQDVARYYTLLNGALNLVPTLAPLLGALLIARWGWRSTLLALAVLALILLPVMLLGQRETAPQLRTEAGGSWRSVLATPGLLRYGACCCGALALIMAYVTLAPGILIAEAGLSPQDFALLFGVNAIVILLASLLATRLLPRVGAARLVATGLWLWLLAGALWLALPASVQGFQLPLAVASVGFSLVMGPANGLAMQGFSRDAGKGAALLGCAQMLSAATLSMVVGLLPWTARSVLGGVAIALGLACLWTVSRHPQAATRLARSNA